MDDARFLNELRRYWDEIARGGPATPGDLDPEYVATIRRLHALPDVPAPDPTYARTLRESIMNAQSIPLPIAPGAGPAVDGASAPSLPRIFPPRIPWTRSRGPWLLVQAASVFLVISALVAGIILVRRDDRPVIVPADATPVATEGEGSNWPMYRGNPARTGESSGLGPVGAPVDLWRFQTQGAAHRSPAIVDGVVYAGSDDGSLYALDAATGAERWRYEADGPVAITPTVIGESAYLATVDGALVAVDTATGAERWTFAESVAPDSTPALVDGVLFVGSDAGILYALDAETGTERWRFAASGGITRSVAVAGDAVYAGTAAGQLHAVDAATGAERWTFVPPAVEGEAIGTTTVANGVVYANHAGTMYALDAATGDERWSSTFEGARPVAASGDTLFTGGLDGQVYALDAATGNVRWTFSTGDQILAAPAVAGDVVYVASFDRNVYALDAATGAEHWRFSVDGDVDYGPSVADGVIYVSTNLGSVFAIGGSETTAGLPILSAPSGPEEVTPDASPVAGVAPVEFVWQTAGGPEPLVYPIDAVVAPDGRLWVIDSDNNRFQIFDTDGAFLETWGSGGDGPGEFAFARGDSPDGSWLFDADGNLYVGDEYNFRVQKFDRDRRFVTEWGSFGSGDGQFAHIAGMAINGEGEVVVCDRDRADCQVFTPDGAFLRTFGGAGSGDGQLNRPGYLGSDRDGNVYIPDYGDHRVVKYGPDGSVLAAWGARGDGPGEFDEPNDVAVDAAGNVYVADMGNRRVQILDADGRYLGEWDGEGTPSGRFEVPAGVTTDGQGNVYVIDIASGLVTKFRFLPPLGSEETATPAP